MNDTLKALAVPGFFILAGIAWFWPGVAIGLVILGVVVYAGLTEPT